MEELEKIWSHPKRFLQQRKPSRQTIFANMSLIESENDMIEV